MLSGFEVDAMSEGQLAEVADSVAVYYRVSPLHKLKIVKALQRGGHVVGMTGKRSLNHDCNWPQREKPSLNSERS